MSTNLPTPKYKAGDHVYYIEKRSYLPEPSYSMLHQPSQTLFGIRQGNITDYSFSPYSIFYHIGFTSPITEDELYLTREEAEEVLIKILGTEKNKH